MNCAEAIALCSNHLLRATFEDYAAIQKMNLTTANCQLGRKLPSKGAIDSRDLAAVKVALDAKLLFWTGQDRGVLDRVLST